MKVDSANYKFPFTDDDKGLLSQQGYHVVNVGNGIRWRQVGVKGFIPQKKVEAKLNDLKNGQLSDKIATHARVENSVFSELMNQVIADCNVDEEILQTGSNKTEHKHVHRSHNKFKKDLVKIGVDAATDLAPKMLKQILQHNEKVANEKLEKLKVTATILKCVSKIVEKIIHVFLSKQEQISENIESEEDHVCNSVNSENLNEFDSENTEEIDAADDQLTVESEQEIEDRSSVGEK